jgi:hypothetical protein
MLDGGISLVGHWGLGWGFETRGYLGVLPLGGIDVSHVFFSFGVRGIVLLFSTFFLFSLSFERSADVGKITSAASQGDEYDLSQPTVHLSTAFSSLVCNSICDTRFLYTSFLVQLHRDLGEALMGMRRGAVLLIKARYICRDDQSEP